ncbi:unnamed protein product [Spirodela intermedia]|uniref:Uncharacterized protein n=1 Tax=Spirodela intermedia TaxID=51605 RepID=A0A7I8JAV5_SPIIN|nr:unnamed protein product [Spirodela intermedia]CAA6667338.1 unnamed protein product [Spirodela intermedia]
MAASAVGHVPPQPSHRSSRFFHGDAAVVSLGMRRAGRCSVRTSPRIRLPLGTVSCRQRAAPPDFSERASPNEVKEEIKECYKVIQRLGRGVLYLGSSRFKPDHPHYQQSMELGREIAKLLGCTTWTGAGPGLMDAATRGALSADKPVGGFKISKEAGQWSSSSFHPYLPSEAYFTCRFFSARKHGLVDAVVRKNPWDRTAVIALPGGIGTLDEVFEVLTLIQLQRLGSELPVPFLLMNYGSFYSKLLAFIDDCERWGVVARGRYRPCGRSATGISKLWSTWQISMRFLTWEEISR